MISFKFTAKVLSLSFIAVLVAFNYSFAGKASDLKYYDVKEKKLPILGKGFTETGSDYSRLPISIKGKVRNAVWDLGQNSAGIAVRFYSNSKTIGVKWELLNSFNMYHMTAAGVRGLDLYTLYNGKWLFAGTAQPFKIEGSDKICRAVARADIQPLVDSKGNIIGDGGREYLMYLPLYDGALKVEIGIDSSAYLAAPMNNILVPCGEPYVFYGTSVTQGGCASRPGMAYTNIIERDCNNETINLGFSGNGRMDRILADEISKVKAKAYFIDCLANCTYQIVKDSTEYFIKKIAGANPDTPVYMISNYAYPYQFLDSQFRRDLSAENSLWYSFYLKFRKEGYKNLRFINVSGDKIYPDEAIVKGGAPSDSGLCGADSGHNGNNRIVSEFLGGNIEKSPLGPDNEGTVDGVHMTDLGFLRFARELEKHIKK